MNWYKIAKYLFKKASEDVGWACIRLNKSFSNKVINWGKKNITDDILYNRPNKENDHGRELDIHITVIYGIRSENKEMVKGLLSKQKPFKVTMQNIDCFETDNYDVVIIKVKSDGLEDINALMEENLNVKENDYGSYKPHCTIAYVKKGEGKQYIGDSFFKGEEFIINKIYFEDKNDNEIMVKLK